MLRNIRYVLRSVAETNVIRINGPNRRFLLPNRIFGNNIARTKKTDASTLSSLFKPVEIKPSQDDINVGAEITGMSVDKSEIMKILNKFAQRREIRLLCLENGLDSKLLKLFVLNFYS